MGSPAACCEQGPCPPKIRKGFQDPCVSHDANLASGWVSSGYRGSEPSPVKSTLLPFPNHDALQQAPLSSQFMPVGIGLERDGSW